VKKTPSNKLQVAMYVLSLTVPFIC